MAAEPENVTQVTVDAGRTANTDGTKPKEGHGFNDVALEVGQIAYVRLSGAKPGQAVCAVVSVDQQVAWFVLLELDDSCRRPGIGQQVEIVVDYGDIALATDSTIVDAHSTRRGPAFAVPYPKTWAKRAERSGSRVAVSAPALALRKKDVALGARATFPVTITDLSTTGARIQSRVSLAASELIVLMFRIPDSDVDFAAVARIARLPSAGQDAGGAARVVRAGVAQSAVRQSHDAGVAFLDMDERARQALATCVGKLAAELDSDRHSKAEKRAADYADVQQQLLKRTSAGPEMLGERLVESLMSRE